MENFFTIDDQETEYQRDQASISSFGPLSMNMIIDAGHTLLADSFSDVCEDYGWSASGQNWHYITPRIDPVIYIGPVCRMIGMIEHAWGCSVHRLFTGMGIPEGEWSTNLGRLLMSCLGAGVSIQDDYGTFADTAVKLGLRKHQSTPVDLCGNGTFGCLAEELYDLGMRPLGGKQDETATMQFCLPAADPIELCVVATKQDVYDAVQPLGDPFAGKDVSEFWMWTSSLKVVFTDGTELSMMRYD